MTPKIAVARQIAASLAASDFARQGASWIRDVSYEGLIACHYRRQASLAAAKRLGNAGPLEVAMRMESQRLVKQAASEISRRKREIETGLRLRDPVVARMASLIATAAENDDGDEGGDDGDEGRGDYAYDLAPDETEEAEPDENNAEAFNEEEPEPEEAAGPVDPARQRIFDSVHAEVVQRVKSKIKSLRRDDLVFREYPDDEANNELLKRAWEYATKTWDPAKQPQITDLKQNFLAWFSGKGGTRLDNFLSNMRRGTKDALNPKRRGFEKTRKSDSDEAKEQLDQALQATDALEAEQEAGEGEGGDDDSGLTQRGLGGPDLHFDMRRLISELQDPQLVDAIKFIWASMKFKGGPYDDQGRLKRPTTEKDKKKGPKGRLTNLSDVVRAFEDPETGAGMSWKSFTTRLSRDPGFRRYWFDQYDRPLNKDQSASAPVTDSERKTEKHEEPLSYSEFLHGAQPEGRPDDDRSRAERRRDRGTGFRDLPSRGVPRKPGPEWTR